MGAHLAHTHSAATTVAEMPLAAAYFNNAAAAAPFSDRDIATTVGDLMRQQQLQHQFRQLEEAEQRLQAASMNERLLRQRLQSDLAEWQQNGRRAELVSSAAALQSLQSQRRLSSDLLRQHVVSLPNQQHETVDNRATRLLAALPRMSGQQWSQQQQQQQSDEEWDPLLFVQRRFGFDGE